MKLLADVSQQTLTLDLAQDFSKILYIGFTANDCLPVRFDGLRFGIDLTHGDDLLLSEHFPPDGVSFDSTDQEFLVSVDLAVIRRGVSYALGAWVENGGQTWSAALDLMLPRWAQPYPSWVWGDVNDCWIAPVSYPADGNIYEWDENTTTWVVRQMEPEA